jgi:hypothetical protein
VPHLLFRDPRGLPALQRGNLFAGDDRAIRPVGRRVVADVEVDPTLIRRREPRAPDQAVANGDGSQDQRHSRDECRRARGERPEAADGPPSEGQQERNEQQRVLAKEGENAQERAGSEPLPRRSGDRKREEERRRHGNGEGLLEELHVVEEERTVEGGQPGRDQGDALVRHRACRSMDREDPENRDRDLKQVDRVWPVTHDRVDGRQNVRVEGRLEEDLGSDPPAVCDLLRPPVVLLAVHRQLAEERLVVNGDEMRQAKSERHG